MMFRPRRGRVRRRNDVFPVCARMEGDAIFFIGNRFHIPARFRLLRFFEPEHRAIPARSLPGQLKHAQNKFCGLRQRFRRAFARDAQG